MTTNRGLFHSYSEDPHLTFHGDQAEAMRGRLFEPGDVGTWMTTQFAFYDSLLNVTDVYLRPATTAEIDFSIQGEDGNFYINAGGDVA